MQLSEFSNLKPQIQDCFGAQFSSRWCAVPRCARVSRPSTRGDRRSPLRNSPPSSPKNPTTRKARVSSESYFEPKTHAISRTEYPHSKTPFFRIANFFSIQAPTNLCLHHHPFTRSSAISHGVYPPCRATSAKLPVFLHLRAFAPLRETFL